MSLARTADARAFGYLVPPPGDVVQHWRYWAGEQRQGQLADNATGSPMVWRPAPYHGMHPGGNGSCLVVPTNDEPASGTGSRGGAGADLFRLALNGAKRVRWGLLVGYHAAWGADSWRCCDFFLDHAIGATTANRMEAKFRVERVYTNGTGQPVTVGGVSVPAASTSVVSRWAVYVDRGAGPVYVDVPGATEAAGMLEAGLPSRNEGKGNYTVVEFDYDYETDKYLALRVGDMVFGDRAPGGIAISDTVVDGSPIGSAVVTNLPSFKYGNNFMLAPSNRIDPLPGGPSGAAIYKSRQAWFKGEEYVCVMSYTDDRKGWES